MSFPDLSSHSSTEAPESSSRHLCPSSAVDGQPPDLSSGISSIVLIVGCMNCPKFADFGNRFGTGVRVIYNIMYLLAIQKRDSH